MKYSSLGLILLAPPLAMFAASANGPTITNSTINYTNSQITITGQNFTGTSTVTFNKINIPLVSVTSTQIVGTLPSNTAAGTYLLTVTNPAIPNQPGTFNVTYGATGPQGPMGPQGPRGQPEHLDQPDLKARRGCKDHRDQLEQRGHKG